MAERTSLITIGCCEIQVGVASEAGTMPTTMAKLGKTYKDTAKIAQAASDITEHFEEGKAAPEVRSKSKKMPVITFSLMDAGVDDLVSYIGGTKGASGEWQFDGDEIVANKAIRLKTEKGLDFEIPNADIEAIINADMSAKGIFLIEFTVTPCAVTAGKAFRGVPKKTV